MAALERVADESTRSRLAWILEQLVDAVLASEPRGHRELRLTLVARGGTVDRGDVTVGFQKHPPE